MSMLAAIAFSFAGAQTWSDPTGVSKLVECYANGTGVRCDFTYTLDKVDRADLSANYTEFEAVLADGTKAQSKLVSFGGSSLAQYSPTISLVKNVPVKMSANFDIPVSTPSFRELAVAGILVKNVPIQKTKKATAMTPAASLDTNMFNVQLFDCQPTSGGAYTCFGATITPRR